MRGRLLCIVLTIVLTLSCVEGVPVSAADSQVVTYPMALCDTESEQLSITVDGKKVPIVKFMSNYDYCHFSFDGTVEIKITASENINTYNVSPQAFEIPVQKDDRTLTFSINCSRYLIVKINGLRDLVIAADDLETDVPGKSGSGIFNVNEYPYNADASGNNLATDAIQRAIDDASAYGTEENPGVVYVPAGLYTFTTLVLKSNVSMYLEGGTVLKASTDLSQYGEVKFHKNSVGLDGYWNIYTEANTKNIKIYGRGTIDGSGMELRYEKNRLNHVLVPMQCSGFTIDGVVIRDGALWTLVPVRCDNVSITNTKHLNDVATNTEDDAIDIVECQNVNVTHTIAVSEDDTYSTKTWEAWNNGNGTDIAQHWAGDPEPLDNVTFDDCFAFTRCAGFKVGWGCYQPQSNITFKNSYVYRCMFALNVTMNYGNVPIKNITFENIDVEGFWPKDSYQGRWLEFWISGGCSGKAENILVKDINIRVENHIPSTLTGRNANSCFDGITFQNIVMPGATEPAESLEEMRITNTNDYIRNLKILTGDTKLDVYEAENATLTGTAEVRTSADNLVSGGKFVGGYDNGGGFVEFDVNAKSACTTYMTIAYITATQRELEVSVNDGNATVVTCPAGTSWDGAPKLAVMSVELKQGSNKIRIGNSSAVAPSIDYIAIDAPVIKNDIDLTGYQMTASYNGISGNMGFRVIYQIEPTVEGRQVVERGLVYGIEYGDNPISKDALVVDSNSEYVRTFAATEKGELSTIMGDSSTAKYYAMTMNCGMGDNVSTSVYTTNYFVRAYAKLDDGSVVYSDVDTFNVFEIADYVYQNQKISDKETYDFVYNKILKYVDSSYKEVEFNWENVIAK